MANPTVESDKAPALARVLRRAHGQVLDAWYKGQFDSGIHKRFPNSFAEEAKEERVREGYLSPMLRLLARYASTGDRVLRDLYLAEWRHYAPHQDGAATLREYFRAVIPKQEQAILAVAGRDSDSCSQWLGRLHAPLLSDRTADRRLRVLTVGDCLLSEIQGFLLGRSVNQGLELDFRYYYFSALVGADIQSDGIDAAIRDGVDAIAVSYLSYQGLPLYRSLLEGADSGAATRVSTLVDGITGFVQDHLAQMRALTDVPILLHNAAGLPLTRIRRRLRVLPALSTGRRHALSVLNEAVAALAEETENCFLVDETTVAARHGLRRCGEELLPRKVGERADFHPARFGQYLAGIYMDVLADVAFFRKKKVLLVDFDNTLWDGVMADGPVEHHLDRQRLLKRLMEHGMVLGAVSKNDSALVRWGEMLLKPDDFAILKINWNLKAQSIREIAAELNLGLDSFVLIDDNPAERALVSEETPQVALLDSTDQRAWKALERLFELPNTSQTEEARKRTRMYREQSLRSQAVRTKQDYPTLMRTLKLDARIGAARRSDLDRITELVQRTNQFNTTTIRYQRGEIEQMLGDRDCQVLVGELADRFGSLGLVGVVIIRATEDEAVLDSFIMSCRAMGFGFEHLLLTEAASRAGGRTVIGRFNRTDRNEPASNLYRSAGFTERESGEWVLPQGSALQAPEWITLSTR